MTTTPSTTRMLTCTPSYDFGATTPGTPVSTKHFHCYCLRSLDPRHPLKTYIGFTTHPHRRIRQHNGILKNGGARRTKRAGRPWNFVLVLHGFPDKISALQFEWAWQHPDRSRVFRSVVGDDEARKIHRRRGVRAKLEIMRILLTYCEPFCTYQLNAHFLQQEHYDLFVKLLNDGMRDRSILVPRMDGLPVQMTSEVKEIEQMPFWIDEKETRQRKKERKRRKREQKQKKKKSAAQRSIRVPENRYKSGEENLVEESSNLHEGHFSDNEKEQTVSCHLCSSAIADEDLPVECPVCHVETHILCLADKLLEDSNAPPSVFVPSEGICPCCKTHIDWESLLEDRKRFQEEMGQFAALEFQEKEMEETSNDDDGTGIGSIQHIASSRPDTIHSHENDEILSATTCHLCSAPFEVDEIPVKCAECQVQTHVLCLADRLLEDCNAPPSIFVPTEGKCPSCRLHIYWKEILNERQVEIEKNIRRDDYEDDDDDSNSDDDIICILDEEEGNDGGLGATTYASETSPLQRETTATEASDGFSGIDLITPCKGLAEMSICGSSSSPMDDVSARDDVSSGGNAADASAGPSDCGIIDLTSP